MLLREGEKRRQAVESKVGKTFEVVSCGRWLELDRYLDASGISRSATASGMMLR